ncbi:hypothetical protein GCM10019016_105110 [Streptomyces prasinosporus]|uniref:Tn3 transposase DDE domain-containing protein n=1 Tax=Streptomyces prasinosporus TaxID=68256 RepID=A0ABP6UAA0_9ACTN
MIRTVRLLRYLSDAQLRQRVTAAANKVEAFHGFSLRLGFGNRGVIADNDPVDIGARSPCSVERSSGPKPLCTRLRMPFSPWL